MVGTRDPARRQHLAGQRAQPALAPVAHHRIADFLGDGEADPLGGVRVAAGVDQQDEPRRGDAAAAVGGQEVAALGQRVERAQALD